MIMRRPSLAPALRALRHGLAALVLLLAPFGVRAAEWDIDQLMQGLAQTRSDRAMFVEKKYIAILDKPVESSGELFYTAPDRLEKRTLKPKPESLVLDGDSITVDQPGKRRVTVSLHDHPEITAFIESIRGTLAGDRSALEKFFTLELTGSTDEWQHRLARYRELVSRTRS